MTSVSTAFFQLCLEEDSTITIEKIRNAALAKIMGGEAKSLISSSVNGKSFSFQLSKPADEIFTDASEAIKAFNGELYTATQPDFSQV